MLFQAEELRGWISASKILPVGKYFALKTLYNKVSVSWCSRHTCFPNRASLNCLKSLNPIPLIDLEEHKVLHLTHCIFLEFSWFPHQNLQIITSISLIKPIGKRKTLMEYVGIDWTTALIITSLQLVKGAFPSNLASLPKSSPLLGWSKRSFVCQ